MVQLVHQAGVPQKILVAKVVNLIPLTSSTPEDRSDVPPLQCLWIQGYKCPKYPIRGNAIRGIVLSGLANKSSRISSFYQIKIRITVVWGFDHMFLNGRSKMDPEVWNQILIFSGGFSNKRYLPFFLDTQNTKNSLEIDLPASLLKSLRVHVQNNRRSGGLKLRQKCVRIKASIIPTLSAGHLHRR